MTYRARPPVREIDPHVGRVKRALTRAVRWARYRRCEHCRGTGIEGALLFHAIDCEDPRNEDCMHCGGRGERERSPIRDLARSGIVERWWWVPPLIALAVAFVWFSVESDRKQCRETGWHRVCGSWIYTGSTIICSRWEKEPCQ